MWAIRLDVEGWLAQFRPPSSITSQTTALLPSKTTLLGLLFAKIGMIRKYDKRFVGAYEEYNKKIKIGIRYKRNNFSKYFDQVTFREISSRTGLMPGSPTKVEYLVLPRYEIIYLLPDDDLILGLKNREAILNNEIFKTYLGKNEALTSILSCEEIKLNKEENKTISTSFVFDTEKSIISYGDLSKVAFDTIFYSAPSEEKKKILKVGIPIGKKVSLKLKDGAEVYSYNNESFMVV